MVGCMAGNPEQVKVGDLVVAKLTFNYSASSMDEGSVQSNAGATVLHAQHPIIDTAGHTSQNQSWTAFVQVRLRRLVPVMNIPHAKPVQLAHPNPRTVPVMNFGPIAGGGSTVHNNWSKDLWKLNKKAWGIKKGM